VPDDFTLLISERRLPGYMKSQLSGRFIPRERQVMASTGVIYDRDELHRLLTASSHPICVITGRPLTDNPDALLV
jgi:hypothetical protein